MSNQTPRESGSFFTRFFFSSRRRHTRCLSDWSSDVCSSDLRSVLSSRISSSLGFFSPPTRVLAVTPRAGSVQKMVQPATASPAPSAKRSSVTLGTRETMREGAAARVKDSPVASTKGPRVIGGTARSGVAGRTTKQRDDLMELHRGLGYHVGRLMVRAAELLYRLLYGGVLSRLPESIAISLGQWGLRHLPLDRLSIFRYDDPRLAVTLGGVRLPNPLILSSMYFDTTILRRAMGLGFGAVTAKSITRLPRPGHPPPNLVRIETPEGPGLVNCNGFHNPGLAAFRAALASLPPRVPPLVSATGESADDIVAVVEGLAPFGDLVEINISSPNTTLVYAWSERPEALAAMLRAARKATDKPLIVKVSPDFRRMNEETTIPAALDAGIGVINCGNTRRIDEPRLSQKSGGLSGSALFPQTLDNVRRLRDRFGDRLDLIATGGIDSPDKV